MNRFLLVATLVFASIAHAAGLDYKKEGAICDRNAGFCVDFMGVSVGLTKLYLGEKAEQKLMAEIRKVGLENFDATTFTMSGGLTCKVKEKTCWTSRNGDKVDARATKTLFGSAEASGAAATPLKGEVFFPEAGTICDKKAGFCADAQGISMGITKMHLGDGAQKKQMALMKKGGYNQTYFILSDGIACNTADRKCYVGEFDSTVDATHTKALFGK